MAINNQDQNLITTPEGVITTVERQNLLEKYPSGIPQGAVTDLINERGPLPVDPAIIARQVAIANIKNLDTRENVELFNTLTDREKFDKAVEIGLIPKGSQFVAGRKVEYAADVPQDQRTLQTRDWGYYTPEQVAQIEEGKAQVANLQAARIRDISRAQEAIIKNFEANNTQLPDKQWINTKELNELKNASPDIYTALTQSGFDAANKIIGKQQEALQGLEKYKTDGNFYNVKKYFEDNNADLKTINIAAQKLADAGFTNKDIQNARFAAFASQGAEITPITAEEFEERKPTWIERKAPLALTAWQLLTPWADESGESLGEFVKATPKRLIKGAEGTQTQMKAIYQSEQTAPLWQRVLFGSTVSYDKANDRYMPIVKAEVPEKKTAAIKSVAEKVLKTIPRKDTGMSPEQYARFLKYRIEHPGTTPFGFKAAEAFEFEKVMQAARIAQIRRTGLPGLMARQLSEKAKVLTQTSTDSWEGLWSSFDKQVALRKLAELNAQEVARKSASALVAEAARNEAMWRAMAAKSISNILPFGISIPDNAIAAPLALSGLQLSTAQLMGTDKITTRQLDSIRAASGMTKKQLAQIAESGKLAQVITRPNVVTKIVEKTTPLTTTETKLLNSALSKLENLNSTQVQSLTQTEAKVLAKAITKLNVLSNLEVETAVSLGRAAANESKTQARASTKPEEGVQPLAQVAALTSQERAILTKTATLQPKPMPKPVPTPTPTEPRPTRKAFVNLPITIPTIDNKSGGAKLTKKEKSSAVSWPQGFGWWVVFVRNGKRYRFFHKGQKPPRGIKNVVQGIGEAKRGIQRQKGVSNIPFSFGLGVVDVKVGAPTKEPGKAGAIEFTGSGLYETKPRLSDKRPRVTSKRPRIGR